MSDEEAPQPGEVANFVGVPAQAPSYFADGCIFAAVIGDAARLQFVEAIPGALDSTDPGTKMRYIFNIVMPQRGMINMLRYILSILPEDMRKEVLDGL